MLGSARRPKGDQTKGRAPSGNRLSAHGPTGELTRAAAITPQSPVHQVSSDGTNTPLLVVKERYHRLKDGRQVLL